MGSTQTHNLAEVVRPTWNLIGVRQTCGTLTEGGGPTTQTHPPTLKKPPTHAPGGWGATQLNARFGPSFYSPDKTLKTNLGCGTQIKNFLSSFPPNKNTPVFYLLVIPALWDQS